MSKGRNKRFSGNSALSTAGDYDNYLKAFRLKPLKRSKAIRDAVMDRDGWEECFAERIGIIKEQKQLERKRRRDKIRRWRDFEIRRIGDRDNVLLRVNDVMGRVETSDDYFLQMEEAKDAYGLIMAGIRKLYIGGYRVDTCETYIKVGCQKILMSEIKRLGKAQGW